MSEQQLESVKDIKEVLSLVASLHIAYEGATEDLKIDVKDLSHLFTPMQKILPAIDNISAVQGQFQAMTPEAKGALMGWFKQEYNIKNDNVEELVEETLDAVLALAKVVLKIVQ